MSPRIATVRRPPARSRRCASAARIATGFAFQASLISSPPPGSSRSCERQREKTTSTGSSGGGDAERSADLERGRGVRDLVAGREREDDLAPARSGRACARPGPPPRAARSGARRARPARTAPARARPRGARRPRPAGSSSSSSAFARAMFSSVPSSSRCTGAIAVITPRSGRAISASERICPAPRIAISVTTTSVSGSIRHSVSGRPISLLKPSSAATVRRCGRRSAARMSFVDVLPTEPVIATTRASLRARTARPSAAMRRVLVAGHERRRGAARARVVEVRRRRRRARRRGRPGRPGASRSRRP